MILNIFLYCYRGHELSLVPFCLRTGNGIWNKRSFDRGKAHNSRKAGNSR